MKKMQHTFTAEQAEALSILAKRMKWTKKVALDQIVTEGLKVLK